MRAATTERSRRSRREHEDSRAAASGMRRVEPSIVIANCETNTKGTILSVQAFCFRRLEDTALDRATTTNRSSGAASPLSSPSISARPHPAAASTRRARAETTATRTATLRASRRAPRANRHARHDVAVRIQHGRGQPLQQLVGALRLEERVGAAAQVGHAADLCTTRGSPVVIDNRRLMRGRVRECRLVVQIKGDAALRVAHPQLVWQMARHDLPRE